MKPRVFLANLEEGLIASTPFMFMVGALEGMLAPGRITSTINHFHHQLTQKEPSTLPEAANFTGRILGSFASFVASAYVFGATPYQRELGAVMATGNLVDLAHYVPRRNYSPSTR
jgi:hypothetical protein